MTPGKPLATARSSVPLSEPRPLGSGCLPVAAIILAAGTAKRMGQLKQLLPYKGRALVNHAIQQALEAGFNPVIVVVGAEADTVRKTIASQPIEIVQNDQWPSGMGSSIVAGVRRLQEMGADSAAVAMLVADQPLVTSGHLAAMRRLLHTGGSPIVAAQYNGIAGVPALFKRELFGALASLAPRTGARELLRNSGVEMTEFALPEAAIDLDTPQDFEALTSAAETRHQT